METGSGSFERQLDELLSQVPTIPDALELINGTFNADDPKRSAALSNFHLRAAWIFFNQLQFPQAFQHFSFAPDFDRKKLMQYWEQMESDKTAESNGIEAFIRTHLAKDGDPATEVDPSVVRSILQLANDSMAQFSIKHRQALLTRLDLGDTGEIRTLDTIILKLKASGDDRCELDPIYCHVDDVRDFLISKGRRDMLAWLMGATGDFEAALEEWATLEVAEEVATILQKSIRDKHTKSKEFLVTYIPKLLQMTNGPHAAVEVFTSTLEWPLESSEVLDLLRPDEASSLTFLEHTTAKKDEKRLFTELALRYLQTESERLLRFLEDAKSLDTDCIVGRLNADQHRERVALLRRQGNHKEALRILVCDLQDIKQAEIYCHCEPYGVSVFHPPEWATSVAFCTPPTGMVLQAPGPADTEPIYAGHLFLLLEVLLDHGEEHVAPLLGTFAVHPDLHPTKVLPIIPSTMKLCLLTPYLRSSFGYYLHEQRLTSVQAKLSSMAFLQTFKTMAELKQQHVSMTQERACPFCHKRIQDRAFAAMPGPNGACAHIQCANAVSE